MQVEDVHRWHDEIFTRMAKAGWVEKFAYAEGQGWFVTWTAAGAGHSQVLKALSEALGLREHDRAALGFDALVRGEPLPSELTLQVTDVHPLMKEGWRDAIDQLALARDEDGLLILMHLVANYAPDHKTPISNN